MTHLQDWPEPVTRVQTLSELPVIPDKYIKPPYERPEPSLSIPATRNLNIPLVDLAHLYQGDNFNTPILNQIYKACQEWGFFQIVNHGVSPDLMLRARGVWREFFSLPVEKKEEYASSPRTYEGYGSRLGVEKNAILDWNDYFYLHYLPPSLKDPNKWPSLPTSCRDVVEEYSSQMVKLSETLMKILSINLGLQEEFLQNAFGGDDVGACVRVNLFPKCPEPDLTLGLSSHSDPGGLTILLPDDHVSGLQVLKDGYWITIQPAPDSFIVNIGDQIQVLSNAIYKSIEHRVIVNSVKERISIAFWYNPRGDIVLEPAKELVTPHRSALYQPMTFDNYRLYIRTKGPQGKRHVDSLEVLRD